MLEWVYLYIFTFELCMKVIAYGFLFHKHSYLRDAWCQLDFVVVTLAWLPILFPSVFGNMSAVRSVRALRPLRALRRVPGMPVLVGSILQSMPALGNVGALAGFIFLVFGIVGMELFKGILHYRCALPGVPEDAHGIPASPFERMLAEVDAPALVTSALGNAATSVGAAFAAASLPAFKQLLASPTEALSAPATAMESMHLARRQLKGGGGGVTSTNPQGEFDEGTLCFADPSVCDTSDGSPGCFYFQENPDGGTISFDNVAAAMIPIIQAITFDTWTSPMFDVMLAYHYDAWIYFIGIAVIGGMFVVNLFLAVIFDEFMRAQASNDAEKEINERAPKGDPTFDVNQEETTAFIKAGRAMSDGTEKAGPGCCDCTPTGGCRLALKELMTGKTLGDISTGFVVFNLVIMCMPYAGQPESWENLTEGLSSFVTWVFIVEMFFKIIALGCTGYWSDSWNLLDGIIVSLSIGEMLITILLADTGINISFLRMLRLLRLLRLLKAWPGLYKIVMSFVKAVPQISNLFVLMFLMMFIFSLLGMQIFGATGVSVDSRWHFDYFFTAMLTVFGIFTGGWVDAFQVCAAINGVLLTSAFFIPGLIIGFFIIMNLFVAILLEAFADEEEEEEEEAPEGEGAEPEPEPEPVVVEVAPEPVPLEGVSLFCLGPENGFRNGARWLVEHPSFDAFIVILIIISSISLAMDVPRVPDDSELKIYLKNANYVFTFFFVIEMTLKVISYGFLFTPNAYLKSGWNVLDFCIVIISILSFFADVVPAFGQLKSLRILRVLRPLRLLQRNPGMKLIIGSLIKTLPSVVEVMAVVGVFHIVFAIMGMQMFAGKFGSCTDEEITTRAECVPAEGEVRRALFNAPALAPPLSAAAPQYVAPELAFNAAAFDAYDDAEVPAPLVPATPSAAPLVDERALEAHLLASSQPLQPAAVESAADKAARLDLARRRHQRRVLMSTREYRHERDKRMKARAAAEEGGEKYVAARRLGEDDLPTEWLNPAFGSFDDFKSAMLVLYVSSTGDNWEGFMFAGMDATGVDMAPERNDFSPMSIYFLIWMLVGNFVCLNLFVGAIVDNFTRIKQESDGSATMTPEQQQWVAALKETMTNTAVKAPREPKWAPRKAVFHLVRSKDFDITVISVIILNVLAMACNFHRIEETSFYSFYTQGMMFFTYFYYCEFVLKFFGLGCAYFGDTWNRFDFFLVCVSFADQNFSELLMTYLPVPPTMLRILRVLRVLRILRLLRNLKGLRDLVMTLVFSIPALANVGSLLGLVIFMYAVLAMNIFTYVQHGENLSDERNFETFISSCLLLFQCLTGDSWSGLMSDAMISEERGCDPHPADGSPSDCGSWLALPFFISFLVIGTFVMLNLVVAVILENFTSLGNVNPDLVSTDDITDFKEAWAKYDPDANGQIPAKVLPELVLALAPPLGISGTKEGTSASKAYRFCLSLGLTQDKGEIAFRPTLDALINKNYANKQVRVAKGQDSPPAVREMLMMRQQTISNVDVSNITPGGLKGPLSARRFEMSRILAEELLRMFIKRKREHWEENPTAHPSYRKGGPDAAAAAAGKAPPKPAPTLAPKPAPTPAPAKAAAAPAKATPAAPASQPKASAGAKPAPGGKQPSAAPPKKK